MAVTITSLLRCVPMLCKAISVKYENTVMLALKFAPQNIRKFYNLEKLSI